MTDTEASTDTAASTETAATAEETSSATETSVSTETASTGSETEAAAEDDPVTSDQQARLSAHKSGLEVLLTELHDEEKALGTDVEGFIEKAKKELEALVHSVESHFKRKAA